MNGYLRLPALGRGIPLLIICVTFAISPVNAQTVSETLADREILEIFEAANALEVAVERGEVGDEALLLRAQEIVSRYERVLRDNPGHLYGWILFARFLERVGRDDAALHAYLRADEIDDEVAAVKQGLGNLLSRLGEHPAALGYLLLAVDLDPEEAAYAHDLGMFLRRYAQELTEDGVLEPGAAMRLSNEALTEAHKRRPGNIDFAMRWAESFALLEPPDWSGSENAWRSIADLARSVTEEEAMRLHLARALVELEQWQQARKLLGPVRTKVFESNRQELLERVDESGYE